ncbi:hypothetical protein DQ04_03211010 [Trypanosoma grayi]|uniref:hypothetical protein n=1 Tax=Trypanosoma grayi TaxID=71804 RepID=UPI0004F4438F|nr:hypothetical protein DQ04_03211010 [Trypanosoma grayi]KEG10857.1 hypothetical protein DQ04_03211010 [Trypanosoma grayi]
MVTEEVRVVYSEHPPPGLRLREEERRDAVFVAVPAEGMREGRGVVSAAGVATVACKQLQLPVAGAALQLSLHGVVLSPQQDVVDLLESIPQGTRSRIVFLLSPVGNEELEEQQQKQKKSKTRGVVFAEALPPSTAVSVAAMGRCAMTQQQQQVVVEEEEALFCVNEKSVKERFGTPTAQCLFRESWLNPKRCSHCHRVREQHSTFSPTRQEAFASAMTLANEGVCLRWKQAPPKPHQAPRVQPHNPPQGEDQEERTGGAPVLPYYYADPQQWEPQRGAQYHACAEACHDFFMLWGNPTVCARCHRAKDAHRPEAIPPTPRLAATPAGRVRRPPSSNVADGALSPCRVRKSCELFTPLWNNNEYCSTCYMQKSSHASSPAVGRSSLSRVTPRRRPHQQQQPVSTAQPKQQRVTDWLSTSANESGESAGEMCNSSRAVTTVARNVERLESMELVAAAGASTSTFPPPSSFSALLMPQTEALAFSCAPLEAATRRSVVPSWATSPSRVQRMCGVAASARDIPWDIVLRYVTLEGLLVCRNVCRRLHATAVPLIEVNCRYILDTLDVPLQKRNLLATCADRYASVIVDAMSQKVARCDPADAATHPLRFFRHCVLQLFRAAQAVVLPSGSSGSPSKKSREFCVVAAAAAAAASPAEVAVVIAARGAPPPPPSDLPNRGSPTHMDEGDIDFVRSVLQSLVSCDTITVSQMAIECIVDSFDAIGVAAAASLVRLYEDEQQSGRGNRTECTQFLSLGEFFEEFALMPLVDFLHAVEVVAQMKWWARGCLDVLRRGPCQMHGGAD